MFSNSLKILNAGSINKYVQSVIAEYNHTSPQVQVEQSSMGSLQCIKRVQEGEIIDLLILADNSLIESMMFPRLTDWYYIFASNRMVLASAGKKNTPEMDLEGILNNWQVTFAHTNPQKDPCGYRTLLLWKLAEKYFGISDLFQGLLNHPGRVVYDSARDMVKDLAAGQIDFIFEYGSVAEAHQFKIKELDERINFANPNLKNYYHTVDLVINPTLQLKITGSPIAYALTVPLQAKNKEKAFEFIKLFIRSEIEKYGLKHRSIPWGNCPQMLLMNKGKP